MSEVKHRQAGREGARETWRGLPGLLQTPGKEGARRGGTPMGRRLPELPRGRAGFITVHGAGKLRVHGASGGTLRSLLPCQGDRQSQTDYGCPGPAWQSRRAEFTGPHCPGYLAAPRTKLQVFKEMPEGPAPTMRTRKTQTGKRPSVERKQKQSTGTDSEPTPRDGGTNSCERTPRDHGGGQQEHTQEGRGKHHEHTSRLREVRNTMSEMGSTLDGRSSRVDVASRS